MTRRTDPATPQDPPLRGIGLVLEGEAHRVTDAPTLQRLSAVYRTRGRPAEVEGDARARTPGLHISSTSQITTASRYAVMSMAKAGRGKMVRTYRPTPTRRG